MKYEGKEQHGYWWLHYNHQLKYTKTCHGETPEDFFQYAPCVKWWHVRCELDFYRMLKEERALRKGAA
jgi:hypothetical protein